MCEHFLIQILKADVILELLDIADHYHLVRYNGSEFQTLKKKNQRNQ